MVINNQEPTTEIIEPIELEETEPTIIGRIAKLIDVKSITTFMFSLAFILSVFKGIQSAELADITRTIVVFFFGTKYGATQNK